MTLLGEDSPGLSSRKYDSGSEDETDIHFILKSAVISACDRKCRKYAAPVALPASVTISFFTDHNDFRGP